MTSRPSVIVTDIEGTTSDIDFVRKVLFPYSREALPDFVREHAQDPLVAPWVAAIAAEIHSTPDNLPAVIAALWTWIDADRKHTALKALQGLVWERAFAANAFRAHVYPDAVAALRRWRREGLPVYVYSSGSVPAQELYVEHTAAGDLRDCFRGHFDTTSGGKREERSYRTIAATIEVAPADILFLSDIGAELDAARAAGWRTVQVLREGTPPADGHPWVASFDELGF